MATLAYLMDKIAKRLRLEGGTVTQTYSEDAIVLALQHKFDVLFDEYWFDQFVTRQEVYTLDASGTVIGDLSQKIKAFKDIRHVFAPYGRQPLPRAPDSIYTSSMLGPCVQPVNDKTKVFRILPASALTQVAITYRTKPANFENDNDEIDMDEQMLILGTCYDMLADDGLNPGAEDKFKNMFDARVTQITSNQHNMMLQGGGPNSGWGGGFIVQPIVTQPTVPTFEDVVGEF